MTILVLAACGSASIASSSANAPATGAAHCGPAAGHTLAASGAARVYSLRQTVYGCSARTGRHFRLGNAAVCIGSPRVGPVTVTGELAAYGSEACGIDTGSGRVIVKRLSDGRQLSSDPATSLPLGPESYQTVTSIVLRAGGEVAWIAVGSSIARHRKDIEVHKHDRTGKRLLDSGTSIQPGSLRLHGSRLTWRHGSGTSDATFS